MLKQRMKLVDNSNVSFAAISCNTAHILLPELQKISRVPFVSMIDETVRQVYKNGFTRIGLLGTPSTIKYGLYQTAFAKYGISVVVPQQGEIKILEKVIRNVLKGKILETDSKKLALIADSLKGKRAQGIILGCTELPLVFPKYYSLPVYNSVEILAMALLKKYYAKAS